MRRKSRQAVRDTPERQEPRRPLNFQALEAEYHRRVLHESHYRNRGPYPTFLPLPHPSERSSS